MEDTDLALIGDITPSPTRPKALDRTDRSGTEDITAEDVKLPRLAIAQGLSPQMIPGGAQFIDGLTMFDMFNDMTEQIYGKGPLDFVPVRRYVRRMEFIPIKEGGGLVDPDVPVNDSRLRWTKSSPELARADLPPKATVFVEFVVLLCKSGKEPEPIVLSIASKNKYNRRASDTLTTNIKFLKSPIYAGMYTIDTKVPGKNDSGTFGVFTIKPAGFVPIDTPAGLAFFNYAKVFHESLVDKTITVTRETDDDSTEQSSVEEDIPF